MTNNEANNIFAGSQAAQISSESIGSSHYDLSRRIFQQCTIAVITALPLELAAVRAVFKCKQTHTAPSGQTYYITHIPSCDSGVHTVAITLLTSMGTNPAAGTTVRILADLPMVQVVVMIGIAGAIPCPISPEKHVRLGDVVVPDDKGTIQFDFGKQEVESKFEYRGSNIRPYALFVRAVRILQSDMELGEFS